MPKKKAKGEKNPIAQAMVALRWKNTTKAERSEYARALSAARWAGHVAKRPAAGRNPAKKKKRA
jgi:hypothetical protein